MPKAKVKEVIDGDTVRLPYNKFIRLANVDAPEKNQKGGAAAKHELEKLVENKTISYTEDAISYGRIVGTVKVGGKNVNNTMKKFIKRQK
ncbi:thermonuclease family protein [Patescibacteria group bacterium]|nr:thermonuclease family protein [Patescibacteria group bacterium]MBU1563587.1 thermonuclease family protein [Patescibacteria group bacterium]MBU2068426.1 thermonuclease family protein [Patescibacteria group bacterium]